MSIVDALFTHAVADSQRKSAFFFSRFNFDRARKRGNTHYCFHCGGDFGFKPGKDGIATNCEDDKVSLYRADGSEVKVKAALEDAFLAPHLANSPGYPLRKPGDRGYEEWLEYGAHFSYSQNFVKWANKYEYRVYRYNPMERHDPITHAEAVVGDMQKYRTPWAWLEKAKLPDNFPYVISIPSVY